MEQEKNDAQKHRKEHTKPLILVVDGNMLSQFTTSVILQRLEYLVYPVKTAEEALAAISITPPSVVLSETALPQMSGLALLQRIKKDKGTKNIPVIIYTREHDLTARQVYLQAGCEGYLTYPADPNHLYEIIQQVTETTPRHFVRLSTHLEVAIGKKGASEHDSPRERVSALSVDGMYVSTVKPVPYGTILPFTLFLQDAPQGSISFEGKVLYSYSYDGRVGAVKQPGMGIKFTNILPEDRTLVKNYIQKKLMEGIAVAI